MYLFDSWSKEEKFLLAKFFTYVFNFTYKWFICSRLRVRVSIPFPYLLVVLYLVLNNHECVLAPFSREFDYADDRSHYSAKFYGYKIVSDRLRSLLNLIVLSRHWRCLLFFGFEPRKMLFHQYAFCLMAYFKSYYWALSVIILHSNRCYDY